MKGIILGVDPGASGGCALLGGYKLVCWATPKEEGAIAQSILRNGFKVCYMEKVWGRNTDSKQVVTAFMKNYGFLRGVVTAKAVEIIDVLPSEWQKEFGLFGRTYDGTKSQQKTQKKNDHKKVAQEIFPEAKVTHATADALLIAEYGRRRGWPLHSV